MRRPKVRTPRPSYEELPTELRELVDTIAWLRMLAAPTLGGSVMELSASHGASATGLDGARRRLREMLDEQLAEIRKLRDAIEASIATYDRRAEKARVMSAPVSPALNRSWQCARCAKRQRNGAKFCDGCGAARPDPLGPREARSDAR